MASEQPDRFPAHVQTALDALTPPQLDEEIRTTREAAARHLYGLWLMKNTKAFRTLGFRSWGAYVDSLDMSLSAADKQVAQARKLLALPSGSPTPPQDPPRVRPRRVTVTHQPQPKVEETPRDPRNDDLPKRDTEPATVPTEREPEPTSLDERAVLNALLGGDLDQYEAVLRASTKADSLRRAAKRFQRLAETANAYALRLERDAQPVNGRPKR